MHAGELVLIELARAPDSPRLDDDDVVSARRELRGDYAPRRTRTDDAHLALDLRLVADFSDGDVWRGRFRVQLRLVPDRGE